MATYIHIQNTEKPEKDRFYINGVRISRQEWRERHVNLERLYSFLTIRIAENKYKHMKEAY